jgi:hypothetical protein
VWFLGHKASRRVSFCHFVSKFQGEEKGIR